MHFLFLLVSTVAVCYSWRLPLIPLQNLKCDFAKRNLAHRLETVRRTTLLYCSEAWEADSSPLDRYEGDPAALRSFLKLDEFDRVLDALRIYKQIYNDFLMDTNFQVPHQPPWPRQLYGLNLGKLLERYLSSRQFFEVFPEKVQALQEIGLEPKLSNLLTEWDVIVMTLRTYKEVYGNLRIRQDFIVPNEPPWPRFSRNMRFGARMASLRSSGRRVANHPERKALLDEMGFVWQQSDGEEEEQTFGKVLQALSVFSEQNGHVDVPRTFVVPESKQWGKHLWNFPLGEYVEKIREEKLFVAGKRERRLQLNELNFNWRKAPSREKLDAKFDLIIGILTTYHALYGHCRVPHHFRVPDEPPWDSAWAGMQVGPRVRSLKLLGESALTEEQRKKLEDLGFEWAIRQHKTLSDRYDLSFLHGPDADTEEDSMLWKPNDVEFAATEESPPPESSSDQFEPESVDSLPRDYRRSRRQRNRVMDESIITASIPESEVWDNDSQEMRSGPSIRESRSSIFDKKGPPSVDRRTARELRRQVHREEFARLLEMSKENEKFHLGRIFDPSPVREENSNLALEEMFRQENSLNTTERRLSVVHSWKTIDEVNKINSVQFTDEQIADMKALGFELIEFDGFRWHHVIAALRVYHSLYEDVDVPLDFVIDEKIVDLNVGFEKKWITMRLGDIVHHLRIGDADGLEDPKRKKELDELGFNWGNLEAYQRYRFTPLFIGLRLFYHLYGNTVLRTEYVIPDDPMWPYWMIGMPLGKWSAILRVQQQMVAKYYPERKELFDDLGFLWWLPPGNLEEKYFEPVTC